MHGGSGTEAGGHARRTVSQGFLLLVLLCQGVVVLVLVNRSGRLDCAKLDLQLLNTELPLVQHVGGHLFASLGLSGVLVGLLQEYVELLGLALGCSGGRDGFAVQAGRWVAASCVTVSARP
ncbi:hypothetical protein [Streptomyces sp. NBC_01334]|uniref:hypothetical protein n=1 Tax=Streptomyces sp. NBC_01334 TaxID=2903827 RepID=UPI002E10C7CE|nr:hypothetical protein OG736_00790 [Streptomyces sp. NBC_01334]